MGLAGGDKQDIAGLEDGLVLSADETAGTAYDDIDFIARMWVLWIGAVRRVEFHGERAMAEQLDKTLAAGSGQAVQTMASSEVSLHICLTFR
jgi:hypothetical protein